MPNTMPIEMKREVTKFELDTNDNDALVERSAEILSLPRYLNQYEFQMKWGETRGLKTKEQFIECQNSYQNAVLDWFKTDYLPALIPFDENAQRELASRVNYTAVQSLLELKTIDGVADYVFKNFNLNVLPQKEEKVFSVILAKNAFDRHYKDPHGARLNALATLREYERDWRPGDYYFPGVIKWIGKI
jgi:hypothetical protein